jgi:hypothetical protein
MRLISGDGQTRPAVGDVGETDHAFAGPGGRDLVLTYFVTPDGGSEWEVEAYDAELEPLDPATHRARPRARPIMRTRFVLLGTTLLPVLVAAGVARLALHRGPREGEVRAFVLGRTVGATGVAVVRNDMDDTGTIWVSVRMSDGTSEEVGYEFAERWVWPWQSYFEADRP